MKSKSVTTRPRIFRPSTIAIVVGIFAFGTYSALNKPEVASSVAYEADSSGRLVRVDRVAPKPTTSPLWKPEPALLLSMQDSLKLDTAQRKRIRSVDVAWKKAKSNLEESMRSSTTFLEKRQQLSVTSAQANLGNYSELSREFGRQREAAWNEATSLLTPSQRAALERIREEAR